MRTEKRLKGEKDVSKRDNMGKKGVQGCVSGRTDQ